VPVSPARDDVVKEEQSVIPRQITEISEEELNSSIVETRASPVSLEAVPIHNFNGGLVSHATTAGRKNPYAIDVYHRQKERAAWTDTDSEDSFKIEPTNVGAYYQR